MMNLPMPTTIVSLMLLLLLVTLSVDVSNVDAIKHATNLKRTDCFGNQSAAQRSGPKRNYRRFSSEKVVHTSESNDVDISM